MGFLAIILFLGLYYVRPAEWIPGVNALKLNYIVIGIAILALVNRERGLSWKELFRTPHDTFMGVFFLCHFWTAPTGKMFLVFEDIYVVFVFYWVTLLTLNTIPRLLVFLHWWTFFICLIAAIAVASEFGIDPTGTYDWTHGRQLGRLSLNLSIFNNPNATGHSVVPAVAMLYFITFWERPFFSRIVSPLTFIIPLYCIYLTSSKGAFISGFATIVNALTFKRPLAVQIAIFVLAGTIGWASVQMLPRMEELKSSKSNEAIQGRVLAFRLGLDIMQNRPLGSGFGTFLDEFEKRYRFRKSSHSSYVGVGAELGKTGLYLFLGILFFCFRTLMSTRTTTVEEERVRRTLFALVISYSVSSWMIGWHNRSIFWLTAAACAAFHRIMLEKELPLLPAESDTSAASPITLTPLSHLTNPPEPVAEPASIPPNTSHDFNTETTTTPAPQLFSKIRWYDLVGIFLCLQISIVIWRYMINHM